MTTAVYLELFYQQYKKGGEKIEGLKYFVN